MLVDVKGIKAADAAAKPSPTFEEDSIRLGQLYADQSRSLTYEYLRARQLGRPRDAEPLELPVLRRIVDSRAVAYLVPPTRQLRVRGEALDDTDPRARALAEVYGRSQVDAAMAAVDVARHLYGTIAVAYVESHARRRVELRVFEPHNVYRRPSALAADCLDEDDAFLLQLRAGQDERDNLYQAWVRTPDGWRCWVVGETGELAEGIEQPYGEEGRPPWDPEVLPVQLAYVELPMGRPYLPLQQSRISRSLAINGLANDILYLQQQESHTVLKATQPPHGASNTPTETGPGVVVQVPAGGDLEALTLSPHLADAVAVLETYLRLSATVDSLPSDEFRADPSTASGAAQRAREKPLATLRARSTPLLVEVEQRGYTLLAAVHNAFAAEWGLPALDPEAELMVTLARPWEAADPLELQQRYFNDLQAGFAAVPDYFQAVLGLGRTDAIALWRRVQADRVSYPTGLDAKQAAEAAGVRPPQAPGALVPGGPHAAMGPGSATPVPGALNLDGGSNNEQASVVGAVIAHG